jgi:hypothetical protein
MLQRPGGKQVGLGLLLSALLSIATFGASLHSPQGKKNETDALALRLTEKFTEADKKNVIVMDLVPAVGEPGVFGRWLADQFSSSLADQGKTFEMVDRLRLGAALEAQHLSPVDESDVKSAIALGKAIDASTVVVGSYGAAEAGIGVSLAAFRVSEYGIASSTKFLIGMVFGKMPLTQDVSGHLGVALDALRPKDGVYRSGFGGVSVPSCIKCPIPPLMHIPDVDIQGMLRAHPQGATVWLNFVVTENGHTRNITAPQPIGFGFDEQYAKAAKDWEFEPAVNADNKPVPVNFVYRISFNFNGR